MINDVFHDLLDEGVVVYLDDILIYSEDEKVTYRLGSSSHGKDTRS